MTTSQDFYDGLPVHRSELVPIRHIVIVGNEAVVVHPLFRFGRTPLFSRFTSGGKELRREEGRHGRKPYTFIITIDPQALLEPVMDFAYSMGIDQKPYDYDYRKNLRMWVDQIMKPPEPKRFSLMTLGGAL